LQNYKKLSEIQISLDGVLLPLSFGCTGKPPELRNLSPVTITVVKDGQPIEGVEVSLYPRQPLGIWGCGGRTNSSGIAVMTTTLQTHYAPGARAGMYAVVLNKQMELPAELVPSALEKEKALPENELASLRAKRTEFLKKNRLIPAVFESAETTPIEIIVTEKTPATLTVDVAKH
jgi:hypothetical protein